MAMAKCRECGTDVSDLAKACPKCGVAKPVKRTSLAVKIIGGIFLFGIIGQVIVGVSGHSASHQTSRREAVVVGAAPEGDAKGVASRIIKHNFSSCVHVSEAVRQSDNSIRAICDGKVFRVFTMHDNETGQTQEIALNCSAAGAELDGC